MISPPASAFSWIRADNVQKQNGQTGRVVANNVIVRVGSALSDHREVEQRRMMKGDQVKILAEQQFVQNGQTIPYYKIRSPRGEFRWVKGDFLIPVDQLQRQQHDSDPFSVPSNATLEPIADTEQAFGSPHQNSQNTAPVLNPQQNTTTNVGDATAFNSNSTAKVSGDRQIMKMLDDNFRAMIRTDISSWKFTDLEHDYQKLHSESSSPAFEHQVGLRLAAIDRYKKVKADHDDFVRLTKETAERDAKLLSMRNQATNLGQFPTTDVGNSVMKPIPESQPGFPNGNALAQNDQFNTTPTPATGGATTPGTPPTAADFEKLSGAGVVQRATPIAANVPTPTHALMTPSGQLLAYLYSDGRVNLDGALGRGMGIYGKRIFDKRLNADVIIVDGFSPVQLSN